MLLKWAEVSRIASAPLPRICTTESQRQLHLLPRKRLDPLAMPAETVAVACVAGAGKKTVSPSPANYVHITCSSSLPPSLLHIGGTCVLPSANSVGRVARLVLAYLWECAIEKTSKQSRGGGGRRGSELEGERESELVASVGKQTEKSAKLRE